MLGFGACASTERSVSNALPVVGGTISHLSPEVIIKLKSAVFEVVVLKPQEDNIEYERPLPMNSIPFAVRNDMYSSVGTAFLMDDNRFYSAAHVFSLHNDSLFGDFYIRDANAKIYKITNITKYASNRDFVAFEVENFIVQPGMTLSRAKEDVLDTQVFSVGNALGEGIIIRDGILTSRTFEEENGAWKWLRFSAAASPGNSGGPLVNTTGEVLGIITMKSQNENLNYALPFSEASSTSTQKGIFHTPISYTLPNIRNKSFHSVIDYTVNLPCEINLLHKKLIAENKKHISGIVAEVRKEFAFSGTKSFATSGGYLNLIYDSFLPPFPFTITLAENADWGTYYPSEIKKYTLPSNGMVYFGSMLNVNMTYIEKPDTVTLQRLIESPKIYMDYILKVSPMFRTIGSEQVAMTSYGDPVKTEVYTDYFGRVWNVAYWHIPFANVGVVAYALPLPDGMYIMSKVDAISNIYNGFNYDIAFLADYVVPRYSASVKNWNEFLSLKPDVYPLSPVFKNMKFSADASNTYLKTDLFEIDFPAEVLAVDDDSQLRLSVGYPFDGSKVSETIQAFDIGTKKYDKDYRYCMIYRNIKPPKEAQKKDHNLWEQMLNQVTPFNSMPYNENQYTFYDEILFLDGVNESEKAKRDVLYLVILEMLGTGKDDEIMKFAEDVKSALRIPSR